MGGLSFLFLFLFFYIIFYCLGCYNCPNFSPFALHDPDASPQAINILLPMSMGPAYMFFVYCIPYAVHYIPMTIL